jgi:hypothetical protein
VKNTKPQEKYKERRETNTPRNVYPVQSKLTYFRGEIDLSKQLSMSSLQRDIKGLQEISFNKLTKNKPLISTFFPISPMNKTLNDFHSPKVFTNVSQPKRTSSKTLNPKVTSFDFSIFSLLKSP